MSSKLIDAVENIEKCLEGAEVFFDCLYDQLPEEGESAEADNLVDQIEELRAGMVGKVVAMRLLCRHYEEEILNG